MKQGRDFNSLVAEINRQAESKADFVVPESSMEFIPHLHRHGTVSWPGSQTRYEITDQASRQLATRLGIPQKYYERMEQEPGRKLLGENVMHWFQNSERRTMIRTLDTKSRAFLSDRYHRIDNFDIMKVVVPVLEEMALKQHVEFVSSEITDTRMYLKIVFPQIQVDIDEGDPAQAGLSISNSEIGSGRFEIAPLVYRKICENGLKALDALTRRHVGGHVEADSNNVVFRDETKKADDKALMMKIEDTLRYSIDEANFTRTVSRFAETKQVTFGNTSPVDIIERLGNTFGLNEGEKAGIVTSLFEQGGGLNGFNVINAVTAFSQKVDNYDRATELEGLGGKLLELKSSEWQRMAA